MTLTFTVELTEKEIVIQLTEPQLLLTSYPSNQQLKEVKGVYLLYKEKELVAISMNGSKEHTKLIDYDQVIVIETAWDISQEYVRQILIDTAKSNGLQLASDPMTEAVSVPQNALKTITDYTKVIVTVLALFGYTFNPQKLATPIKTKSAKAQHRWRKEVSEIEFTTDFRGSQATVIWQKRNEMLLKTGAKMLEITPLNKDGSVGFAAKMGAKIRSDNHDKFNDFVTTADIVLKSVNEVGLFLYFGGTNSWLELRDENGKSIDEWTVVS